MTSFLARSFLEIFFPAILHFLGPPLPFMQYFFSPSLYVLSALHTYTDRHFVKFHRYKTNFSIKKIRNHYVIGSYFFSAVYITKNIYSIWNNHLRVWKLSLCLFLFLYWEEAKKVQTSPYNSANHLIFKNSRAPLLDLP